METNGNAAVSRGVSALAILRSLRPKQWTKNFFLYCGLVFSGGLSDAALVGRVSLGFLAFCLLSGVIYIVNDIQDIEQDRMHPRKRLRPIASGAISIRGAAIAAAIFLAVSFAIVLPLGWRFALCALAYFVMNFFYSMGLKHVVIIDVFCVAMGFVLRAYGGMAIIQAINPALEITAWFLCCTFFLALFLAICKRRHEMISLAENGESHRRVLSEYSPELIDQMVSATTASTILSYGLWTALGKFEQRHMIYTLPFVVFGVFRYLYLVYRRDGGGEPEQLLLNDAPLLACIVLWLAAVLALLS
ncbi:MAG: Decaprenyl-phosphate phosphoribosyltransferase [candidate division BRC1 bacterium ADurb.BinA364]|nr:MAG: Decaprenyl-phosphate phosphoribosyltransferase [candidate division BRC1 bacterium ADurb.BinA364]